MGSTYVHNLKSTLQFVEIPAWDTQISDETAPIDGHPSYEDIASSRLDSAQYREGCSEAELAFRIGLAVRERRIALGLSPGRTGRQGAKDPAALSRLEADGAIPLSRY